MLKIATVVGARPQFIKAAPVSAELRKNAREVLIHTGQHYDRNMSAIFFEQMGIPEPDYNLGVGSGGQGAQTGQMLAKIEEVALDEKPDFMLIYGDTNSTLAGALVAAKLHIPVAHIEAGLRSYDRRMPEEINRIVADQVSDILFCPTQTAVENLAKEGITRGVELVGDVMYDAALHFGAMAEEQSKILEELGLKPKEYILATIHRQSNTDDINNLKALLEAFIESGKPIVFPVHPRTRKAIFTAGLEGALTGTQVNLIDPLGYIDFLRLEKNAAKILTDSGGVQKEAFFFAVPCVTLRDTTEWVETVESGWNVLVHIDKDMLLDKIANFNPAGEPPKLFGDGRAAFYIAQRLTSA